MEKCTAAARLECTDECQQGMGGESAEAYMQEHQHGVTEEFPETYSLRDVRVRQ